MTAERIPMGRMFIDDEMLDTAQRILASGQWIKGPESKAFGAEWAAYCGALGGTPCSNGSVALIAALHALDVGHGADVNVPSHTYIASATCITMVGANPVFVEIDADYYTLEPGAVEAPLGREDERPDEREWHEHGHRPDHPDTGHPDARPDRHPRVLLPVTAEHEEPPQVPHPVAGQPGLDQRWQ